MSIIGEFVKSAKDFIVAGPKLNRSSRAEIRDAVGKLADQLDASVVMVQAYLQNSRTFSNDRDLVQHLRQARSKLLQTYHEFRICQGLYEIRDRFAQVFDPVRASVSVGHGRRIRSLIDSLTAGERGIIDDLKALFDDVESAAANIEAAKSTATRRRLRVATLKKFDRVIANLGKDRDRVSAVARQVVDEL